MRRGFYEWEVDLENGETYRVVCDQRDSAKWEVQDFFDPARYSVRARFTAWSAMTRQGLYKKPWEHFNTKDCAVVAVPDDQPDDETDEEDGEGEQGVDPGPAPSAGGRSSASRSSLKSRSATS